MLAKRFKATVGKNTCFHSIIFCKCACDYLEHNQTHDRPFKYNFILNYDSNEDYVGTGDGKVKQASHNQQILLVNVGLKISSILCGDITTAPHLPRECGNFMVSKIYYNDHWAYIW